MIKKLLHRYFQFRNHPIASKNMLRAISKYVWFNIIPASDRQYKLIDKLKFFAKKGEAGIVPNIYFGLFEFEETGFLIHFLKEGDLFVDVGANLGEYTILASGYARAKTIAIEPVLETFNGLKRNIELNSLGDSVTLLKLGIGSSSGELYFTTGKGAMNHVCLDGSAESFISPVDTLDNLLKDQKPCLIKIDVEGYEKEVLNGGKDILQSPGLSAIIIEMNNSGVSFNSTNEVVHGILIENGFRPYQYFPFQRTLVLLNDYRKDQFNTLYLRNVHEVTERLLKGKKIEIFGITY